MQALGSRILVVAFDGWNDAGEAATSAIDLIRHDHEYERVHTVDPELYFDYQYTRPMVSWGADGQRTLRWPEAGLWRPLQKSELNDADVQVPEAWLLTGSEPARAWQAFTAEFMDLALRDDVTGVVTIGAMLSDVPHTRPISIFASSQNEQVREELGLEKSLYEGPVGILSAIEHAAEQAGLPTASLWASVPHYVASTAPSPKATLALLDRFHEMSGIDVPRENLRTQAATWEASIDAAAAEDDEMADYIRHLERARDTWDSPEASGDAIAQAFERYLRRNDPNSGDHKR
ncbi:PAC2 family protein [Microbacterium sp. YY-01]|uniref:PAC2 family protein n=1 Tax=Microbacterium sp. YY-01 TaxID=3421634 RepID=UPI003D1820C6